MSAFFADTGRGDFDFLSPETPGDVSRFPRGKQVASYLGLIPRESRSHREQPEGAPGRRKLDREVDWALSHPVETGCSHRRIMADVGAESMVGGTMFRRK